MKKSIFCILLFFMIMPIFCADKASLKFTINNEVIIDGNYIQQIIFENDSSYPEIINARFIVNKKGKKIISEKTGQNLGKEMQIVFDNEILLSPTIKQKISSDSFLVSNFQDKEAEIEKLKSTFECIDNRKNELTN